MKAKKLFSMALLAAVIGCTPVTAHAASVTTVKVQRGVCYKVACVIIQSVGNYCPDKNQPDTEIPDTEKPDAGVPDNGQPDTGVPDNSRPGTEAPDNSQPGTGTPDNSQPGTGTPDSSQPGMDTPDNSQSGGDGSDTGTPDTGTPEISVPENPGNLSYAEQVVRLVNSERAKAGLPALTMQTDLSVAANVRAKEIKQSFSHTRPNGSSFSSVLKEQGISYRGAGENIAYGQKTPEQVMEDWMNSSGHRANILNKNFKNIGIGYYQDTRGVNYWVQLFTY